MIQISTWHVFYGARTHESRYCGYKEKFSHRAELKFVLDFTADVRSINHSNKTSLVWLSKGGSGAERGKAKVQAWGYTTISEPR